MLILLNANFYHFCHIAPFPKSMHIYNNNPDIYPKSYKSPTPKPQKNPLPITLQSSSSSSKNLNPQFSIFKIEIHLLQIPTQSFPAANSKFFQSSILPSTLPIPISTPTQKSLLYRLAVKPNYLYIKISCHKHLV